MQGVTNVADLKITHLGQDKDILEKLQQQLPDQNLNGNGIRDGFGPLARPQQPVNRVLFRDENNDETEELEIWKKSRSDSAESDEGLTFASDVNSDSPLGKTLTTVQESPVAKMNMLVRSYRAQEHSGRAHAS